MGERKKPPRWPKIYDYISVQSAIFQETCHACFVSPTGRTVPIPTVFRVLRQGEGGTHPAMHTDDNLTGNGREARVWDVREGKDCVRKGVVG